MFNGQKDQLFSLVKSLTKAEKRNFKLYVNRLQSGGDTKFLQLFEALDKLDVYEETMLLKKLDGVEKKNLSNLKRHLYKQILSSLRLIHIQKSIDIQIREQLDFARILYTKGMYMQSLRLLERIKKIANEHHQDILHLEILEFQKLIESRHITRSRTVKNKMDTLLQESALRSEVTHETSKLSNLTILMQGHYIDSGCIKNEEEKENILRVYTHYLTRQRGPSKFTFFEKANLFQAQMWLNYILLRFDQCLENAKQWINLFEYSPLMKQKDPDLYVRAFYYTLTFLFYTTDKDELSSYLEKFNTFYELNKDLLNPNSRKTAFLYLHLSRLNYHLLHQSYEEALQDSHNILSQLKKLEQTTDIHRILLFSYKYACIHFCCGNFDEALDLLNNLVHLKGGDLREDLHFNSRLLHLMAHYEKGNYDLIGYLVPSLSRSFGKAKDLSQAQKLTLELLKQLIKVPTDDARTLFFQYKEQFSTLPSIPYEQKALNYLNTSIWIESHLCNCFIKDLNRVSV